MKSFQTDRQMNDEHQEIRKGYFSLGELKNKFKVNSYHRTFGQTNNPILGLSVTFHQQEFALTA